MVDNKRTSDKSVPNIEDQDKVQTTLTLRRARIEDQNIIIQITITESIKLRTINTMIKCNKLKINNIKTELITHKDGINTSLRPYTTNRLNIKLPTDYYNLKNKVQENNHKVLLSNPGHKILKNN